MKNYEFNYKPMHNGYQTTSEGVKIPIEHKNYIPTDLGESPQKESLTWKLAKDIANIIQGEVPKQHVAQCLVEIKDILRERLSEAIFMQEKEIDQLVEEKLRNQEIVAMLS